MPGLLSLSKSLLSKIGERKAQCAILELDEQDKPVGDYLAFQYFPETIQDDKQVHWSTKDIPGGSLPIYQWTSSGERIVSFNAIFTSDVDLLQDPSLVTKIKQAGQLRRNIDVRTALLWLRRFMLPRYGATTSDPGIPLTTPPRKLILRIQNSGLGLYGGSSAGSQSGGDFETDIGDTLLHDSMLAIMTQCTITIEAFFPSGLPRIATVQLSFAQIAQLGGAVNFPAADKTLDDLVTKGKGSSGPTDRNGKNGFFPYPIKVTFE